MVSIARVLLELLVLQAPRAPQAPLLLQAPLLRLLLAPRALPVFLAALLA